MFWLWIDRRAGVRVGIFLSVLFWFLCAFSLSVGAQEDGGGGLRIATPPLGYPTYSTENARRNRMVVSYVRYDSDDFDLHGGSINVHSRLLEGEWGGFGLKYGAFLVSGTESGAVQTEVSPGVWVSDPDTGLGVTGANVEPLFEWQAVHRRGVGGWGFRLIPFFGLDTGFQRFDQDFRDSPYSSLILGASGGFQMHVNSPGGVFVSPFAQTEFMHVLSFDDGVEHFNGLMLSYGFDVIWRQYSLSGVVQPLMGGTGMYTVSIGFSF